MISRRFAVFALVAVFALAGCATYPGGRRSAVLPGAALGAAIGGAKGGWQGAAVGGGIGAASGLVLDLFGSLGGRHYEGDNSEAASKIREYCVSKYGDNSDGFGACIGGAYGYRQHYSGSRGGLYAGRTEFLRKAAKDGEQYGRSLGKVGL